MSTVDSSANDFNKETADRNEKGYVVDSCNNSLGSNSTEIKGLVFAFNAISDFSVDQTFDSVRRLTQTIINQYDVTGAIEVLMDVRIFNQLIGIEKNDANNEITVKAAFTPEGKFVKDVIELPAADFIAAVPIENVVSVGRFSTIYSEFANYVASYFGFSSASENTGNSGFSTLFTGDENFNPNNGVFDKAALIKLITGSGVTSDKSVISVLTGKLTVSNLTQLLANAVDTNVFGNRDPINGNTASARDKNGKKNNYGIDDGFFADDLLFVASAGLSVTLKLGLDTELYLSPRNNSRGDSDASGASQDASGGRETDISGGLFTSTSTSTSTLIERKLSAPLLIRLINVVV
jgi:hypothetical protein